MNIVLVDDHQVITEALKNILQNQDGIGWIKTFRNGWDFIHENAHQLPDIVVTDLMMPHIGGVDFIEKCRANFKNKFKIIVLSSISDAQTIKQVIKSGANGFLSKDCDIKELMIAFNEVMINKQYIANNLKDVMINSMFAEEKITLHLSPREKEVLQLVCKGHTIKEIAYQLKLSANTVQYYHRCVLIKFKLKRTSDLIVFAMQNGLYMPDISK
jgi:DNA-binding NarL/FixJ family response regulator